MSVFRVFSVSFGVMEFCMRSLLLKALECAIMCTIVMLVWACRRLLFVSLAKARWLKRSL